MKKIFTWIVFVLSGLHLSVVSGVTPSSITEKNFPLIVRPLLKAMPFYAKYFSCLDMQRQSLAQQKRIRRGVIARFQITPYGYGFCRPDYPHIIDEILHGRS